MCYIAYTHREHNFPLHSQLLTWLTHLCNLIGCPLIPCAKEMFNIKENIAVAIIALIGTCAGSFGGIIAASKLTNFRLEKLEAKVDKHNNFAERMPVVEEDLEKENLK